MTFSFIRNLTLFSIDTFSINCYDRDVYIVDIFLVFLALLSFFHFECSFPYKSTTEK